MTNRPTAPPAAVPEPTHPCVRCGAPVSLADALCRSCNPARLKQPAASQAHGTVFLGIALAVVGMAAAATMLVGGVGPFEARVVAAVPAGDGMQLRLEVANAGSRDGQATCRVWDPTYLGSPPAETFVRTPAVAAGQTLTVEQHVTGLGSEERPLAVECSR